MSVAELGAAALITTPFLYIAWQIAGTMPQFW